MKDKYYYGTMCGCNGIIIACLTFALETNVFTRTLLLMWGAYMFGFGLTSIFRGENES